MFADLCVLTWSDWLVIFGIVCWAVPISAFIFICMGDRIEKVYPKSIFLHARQMGKTRLMVGFAKFKAKITKKKPTTWKDWAQSLKHVTVGVKAAGMSAKQASDSMRLLASAGTMTVNESRREHGLPDVPEHPNCGCVTSPEHTHTGPGHPDPSIRGVQTIVSERAFQEEDGNTHYHREVNIFLGNGQVRRESQFSDDCVNWETRRSYVWHTNNPAGQLQHRGYSPPQAVPRNYPFAAPPADFENDDDWRTTEDMVVDEDIVRQSVKEAKTPSTVKIHKERKRDVDV